MLDVTSNAERLAREIAELIVNDDNHTCAALTKGLCMCDCCPLEGICNDKEAVIKFLKIKTLR